MVKTLCGVGEFLAFRYVIIFQYTITIRIRFVGREFTIVIVQSKRWVLNISDVQINICNQLDAN